MAWIIFCSICKPAFAIITPAPWPCWHVLPGCRRAWCWGMPAAVSMASTGVTLYGIWMHTPGWRFIFPILAGWNLNPPPPSPPSSARIMKPASRHFPQSHCRNPWRSLPPALATRLKGYATLALLSLACLGALAVQGTFAARAIEMWWWSRQPPKQAVIAIYNRLQRNGQHILGPLPGGDTPDEFAGRLRISVETIAQSHRGRGISLLNSSFRVRQPAKASPPDSVAYLAVTPSGVGWRANRPNARRATRKSFIATTPPLTKHKSPPCKPGASCAAAYGCAAGAANTQVFTQE